MKEYELNFEKLSPGVTVLDRDVIVYKKLSGAIAQLLLPKGTRVVKPIAIPRYRTANDYGKLRADKAFTLLIIPHYWLTDYGNLDRKTYRSYLFNGKYTIGKMIKPDGFTKNAYKDCGHGIHFFTKLRQAENY